MTRVVYSPGVLIGNWVEESFKCPDNPCLTLYCAPEEKIDYDKLKPESRRDDFRNNKLAGLDGSIPLIVKHDSHRNCKNFATTNDLVYNHLPKPLCGPNLRYYKKSEQMFHPQQDLMQCFGNATEWGLRENKLHEWACTNVSDYALSEYEDRFVRPQLCQYLPAKERRGRTSKFTRQFRYSMAKPLPPRVKASQKPAAKTSK